jgi:hypothetical protein
MSEAVLLGLSGGVDSAAAALMAKERWPALPFFALHQNLGWDDPAAEGDARAVADLVGAELTVQRTDIAALWRERKYLPMAGMPCPASLELKSEPALLWAAEVLGGSAHWEGAPSRRKARPFVVDQMPEKDGLYVLGFLAGEEARAAKYRQSWPSELGRPVFPLMEGGKNKDDARAIVKRHGLKIDYGGLPRRSCQPCVHWSPWEREILRTIRPGHAQTVADLEEEIGRTFDRRGTLVQLPTRTPSGAEQANLGFISGACGAWCVS